jgi:hypothetical protein
MADFITYTSSLTATNNSTAVTGSGTAFVTDGMRAGDWLWFLESSGPVGYPVASVESATALTLATAYKGSTGGSKSAIGERRWDEEKASDTYRLVNSYIQSLEDTVSVSQAGIRYVYSSTTGMVDPGPGFFRLNNAAPASATAIAFADESGETTNPDASAFINSFDDSTSAVKGYIYIKKAGEPSTFMVYAVTGLTDNSGWSQVSVTYVTGNGSMTNNDACRLEFYRVGNDGFENGLKYTYSTTTTDADPGSGIFRFSSGTFASITNIYMDNADFNGVTVTTLLDSWDDSSNTAHRGTLRFQKVGDPTVFREFSITGAITDGTGYRKIPVTPSVSNGTWTNGDNFVVLFTRTGNKGADGYIPGYKFTFSTTTTDSDPGAGTVRMNNASFGSTTQLFIDNTDSGGNTVTTWLDSLDDSTAAVRGVLRFEKQDDPTIYREFQVTGSIVDGTGYRKITVTPLVSGGSWSNGIAINATFYRTGNAGTDGYAPGFRYTYSSTTTDSDPGAGTLRLNNATHSSATFAYVDNTDTAGATITTWLDGLDDSTQSNHKGYIRIQKANDPAIYREYVVTGSVTDGTGYRKIPLSHVASAGVLANSDPLVITFSRTGNAGVDGYDPGYRYTYSTTTTDSDPGAGILRFNNSTFASITQLFFDNLGQSGADLTAWLDSLDDSGSAVKGSLRIQKAGDPAIYREFRVTGTVVDGTGYRKVPVSPTISNGSLANSDLVSITFARAGDPGTGIIGDGDKGDITVSSSGAVWTIDNEAVTLAKIQSIATARLLGRTTAGTGVIEELTAAQVRSLIASAETLTANRTYYVRTVPATITVTIASPGVVTWTSHGLSTNDPVVFYTTGALPTGITAGTIYYATVTGANTFTISATVGGAAINTTGSQSGTHTASTGNDSNDGLAQTRAGAFMTVQRALNVLGGINIGSFSHTVKLADGLYTENVTVAAPWTGTGSVTIEGNTSTPANVLFNPANAGSPFDASSGSRLRLNGMEIRGGTLGHGIRITTSASVLIGPNVIFGPMTNFHINAINGGTAGPISTGWTISGGGTAHMNVEGAGSTIFAAALSLTLTGTPNFSIAFAAASLLGYIRAFGMSFTGSATGARYSANTNSAIHTNGGGASYFPGNAAGSTATGGIYT